MAGRSPGGEPSSRKSPTKPISGHKCPSDISVVNEENMIPYHDSNASIPAHVVEARTALLCSPNFPEAKSEMARKANKEAHQPGYTVLIVNDLPDQLETVIGSRSLGSSPEESRSS